MRQYDDVAISNYYRTTDAVDRQEERILMDIGPIVEMLDQLQGRVRQASEWIKHVGRASRDGGVLWMLPPSWRSSFRNDSCPLPFMAT